MTTALSGDLFKPFKKLVETLEFHEDGERRQVIATVGGLEFGWADLAVVASAETLKVWKTEVRRRLLSQSSTVVLRTACGCEQMKDLPGDRSLLKSFIVPLMWTRSAMQLTSKADSFATSPMREFRWDGRMVHENGARILEERLSR